MMKVSSNKKKNTKILGVSILQVWIVYKQRDIITRKI